MMMQVMTPMCALSDGQQLQNCTPMLLPPAQNAAVCMPTMLLPTFNQQVEMQVVSPAEQTISGDGAAFNMCLLPSPMPAQQIGWAPTQQMCDPEAQFGSGEQPYFSGQVHKQRRPQKQNFAKMARNDSAAVRPEELEELRRAVKDRQQACVMSRSADSLPSLRATATNDSLCSLPSEVFHQDPSPDDDQVSTCSSDDGITFGMENGVDPVLLEIGDSDSKNFHTTLHWVVREAWPLSLTKKGCRIVQRALEVGSQMEQEQIVNAFHGNVREAMTSPHANFVLQKCVKTMPPVALQFVFAELDGQVAYFARHRYGCRILQRLIEHCPFQQSHEMIAEILADSSRLSRHPFGNFVVQHVLQQGHAAHRRAIVQVLCEDAVRLAKHRVGGHVISTALAHCAPEDVQKLRWNLLGDAGQLADLSRYEYGNCVVRELHRTNQNFQSARRQ